MWINKNRLETLEKMAYKNKSTENEIERMILFEKEKNDLQWQKEQWKWLKVIDEKNLMIAELRKEIEVLKNDTKNT